MKNVYDIKKDKNLNFILPINCVISNKNIENNDILLVVHLFYVEKIEKYLNYLKEVPAYIDILFVTSSPQVVDKIANCKKILNRPYRIIKKNNRGRDVSALLVAGRTKILKYQYVCFLHDKQEKTEQTREDTQIFERCLWENMVGSSDYIANVIKTFEEKPELGVLLPPESISDNFSFFFKNTWDDDFDLMRSLAGKINLKCNLDKEKKPISLGTAFWARVDAIRKLLEISWNYEDFDEEPLASDGTLSHAVERCFAYVAQDAGYDTGVVMTDRFAGERMDYLQEIMTSAFKRMEESLDIRTVDQLEKTNQIYTELMKFANQHSSIYIYGAGRYGQRCAKLLQASLHQAKGFLVSESQGNPRQLGAVPVIPISEIEIGENDGIIIAVSNRFKNEIEDEIKKRFPWAKYVFYFGLLW